MRWMTGTCVRDRRDGLSTLSSASSTLRSPRSAYRRVMRTLECPKHARNRGDRHTVHDRVAGVRMPQVVDTNVPFACLVPGSISEPELEQRCRVGSSDNGQTNGLPRAIACDVLPKRWSAKPMRLLFKGFAEVARLGHVYGHPISSAPLVECIRESGTSRSGGGRRSPPRGASADRRDRCPFRLCPYGGADVSSSMMLAIHRPTLSAVASIYRAAIVTILLKPTPNGYEHIPSRGDGMHVPGKRGIHPISKIRTNRRWSHAHAGSCSP